jgi:ADP-ribose pyrophosphatase YjhB (NUDIX family)
VTTHAKGQGFLSAEDWQWASTHLPIACVDVLPVKRDPTGRATHVGLIRRESPMGELWCHLGGRMLHGESLRHAAIRQLEDSLDGVDSESIQAEPYFVNQYFQDSRPGMGFDPRKHAVAVCFIADISQDTQPTAHGAEAREFQWFAVNSLPGDAEIWPGTRYMIERPQVEGSYADEGLAYEALNARYISHNELMWQTPVLAMTAMAFLMTIALGQGNDYRRALAAALSTMIAVISAQLMAKHSASQINDAEELLRIERRRGMPLLHDRPTRNHAAFSFRPDGLQAWFASKRSRQWWFGALIVLGAVSVCIVIEALLNAFL